MANPQEFGMVYGTPVPGYAAPPGGLTVAAVHRIGAVFLGIFAGAWAGDRLEVRRAPLPAALSKRLVGHLTDLATEIAPSFPPLAAHAVLGAYARLHGWVCMEVFNHLVWLTD